MAPAPPRCEKCNGCWNFGQGLTCDACRYCTDSKRLGGPFRLKQACEYKWCLLKSKKADVERLGKKVMARIKAGKVEPRGKSLVTKNKAGKLIKVKFVEEKSNTVGNTRRRERKALREASPACDYERIRAANIAERRELLRTLDIEAGKNSLAGGMSGGPSKCAGRTLARRSKTEWGVGGKKRDEKRGGPLTRARRTLARRSTSEWGGVVKKGCTAEPDEKMGGPLYSTPTRARRTLARKSTSEWGGAGKKGCSLEEGDVLKQEQKEEDDVEEVAEVMEGGEAVKEETGGEEDPLALPSDRDAMAAGTVEQGADEAAVVSDVEEIGEVEAVEGVDEATSLQQEEGNEHSFLDSARIAKRKMDQEMALLEELKQNEEMKRAHLELLRAGNFEDMQKLAKNEAKLQIMLKSFEEEKSQIIKRQQERNVKAADLEAEIKADERMKLAKEEELKKNRAEVQAALLLFQAAAPSK